MKNRHGLTQEQMIKLLTPEGAEVQYESNIAKVYYYTDRRGYPTAIGWKGNSISVSIHLSFKDDNTRTKYIEDWIGSLEAWEEQKKARRQHNHTLKVGDILSSSWGYDQTNVEFYEIVGTRGRGVLIRRPTSQARSYGTHDDT